MSTQPQPTKEESGKLSSSAKESSPSSSAVNISMQCSKLSNDPNLKQMTEQSKEPGQLIEPSKTTAMKTQQLIAPLLLNLFVNKANQEDRCTEQSVEQFKPITPSSLSSSFFRLVCQLANKSSAFAPKLFEAINEIFNSKESQKLVDLVKPKEQLEKAFINEQGKLLQLIVDVILAPINDESLVEAKGLLMKLCITFPSTTGPMVCRMMFDAIRKSAEQVTADLDSVCLEMDQQMLRNKKDTNKDTQSTKVEGGHTAIQDKFSGEKIVVNVQDAPVTSASNESPDLKLFYLDSLTKLSNKSSSQFTLLATINLCEQIRELTKVNKKECDCMKLPQLNLLWDKLSECLNLLGQQFQLSSLKPVIEAFFVVQAPVLKSKSQPQENESLEQELAHISASVNRLSTASDPSTDLESSEKAFKAIAPKFSAFAIANRAALNHILRHSSGSPIWMNGPFAVLADYSRLLDFDMKRMIFEHKGLRLGRTDSTLTLKVHRANLFEDSYRQLQQCSANEWKQRFSVAFIGEEGEDSGGVIREWYLAISRAIFNPSYSLFVSVDRTTYMINPSSHSNSSHLSYFKFVGRLIAKAILDNQLLDCYFTRSVYKHLLGKVIKYTDMELEDNSLYKGLVYLLEHKVTEIPGGSEMRFVYDTQEADVQKTIELVPGGANVQLTDQNKHDYVKFVCQEKMTGLIRNQLKALLEGFYSLLPKRLISIFNEHELELLISGLPNIDIEDLRRNTEYRGFYENAIQIQWFWQALRSFDQSVRAKFLQFVTGTSKVPLNGFSAIGNNEWKFTINRDTGSVDRLPSAHTCSNQLELPMYESYDKLQKMLLKAIEECTEGFGFV